MKQSLKKLSAVFVLAALLAAVTASTASAYNLDFELMNHTDYDIRGIMASPSENPKWSSEKDSFSPGFVRSWSHSEIKFRGLNKYRRGSMYWDLRLYYAGRWHEWRRIPLGRISRISLENDGNLEWE